MAAIVGVMMVKLTRILKHICALFPLFQMCIFEFARVLLRYLCGSKGRLTRFLQYEVEETHLKIVLVISVVLENSHGKRLQRF